MWYRFISFIVAGAFVCWLTRYVVRLVFTVSDSGEFEIGSTTGWFLGCIFMFVYIYYGRPWIENKKEPKPSKSFGIPFPQAAKVGDVLTIAPNTLNGKMLSDIKHYKWDGETWIEFDPEWSKVYTFHHTEVQP